MKAKRLLIVCLALVLVAALVSAVACDTHTHKYTKWGKDATHHWKVCPDDDAIEEGSRAEHSFVEGVCECGATQQPVGGHECSQSCPECGKCLDTTCQEEACEQKCPGHVGPIVTAPFNGLIITVEGFQTTMVMIEDDGSISVRVMALGTEQFGINLDYEITAEGIITIKEDGEAIGEGSIEGHTLSISVEEYDFAFEGDIYWLEIECEDQDVDMELYVAVGSPLGIMFDELVELYTFEIDGVERSTEEVLDYVMPAKDVTIVLTAIQQQGPEWVEFTGEVDPDPYGYSYMDPIVWVKIDVNGVDSTLTYKVKGDNTVYTAAADPDQNVGTKLYYILSDFGRKYSEPRILVEVSSDHNTLTIYDTNSEELGTLTVGGGTVEPGPIDPPAGDSKSIAFGHASNAPAGAPNTFPNLTSGTVGQQVTIPEISYNIAHYTFNGWNVYKLVGGDWESDPAFSRIANGGSFTMPNYAIKLVSNFSLNNVTIKFDSNGGTGDAMPDYTAKTYGSTLSVTVGSAASYFECKYTGPSGAAFKYWSTKADGSAKVDNGFYLTEANGVTENDILTLYAIWDTTSVTPPTPGTQQNIADFVGKWETELASGNHTITIIAKSGAYGVVGYAVIDGKTFITIYNESGTLIADNTDDEYVTNYTFALANDALTLTEVGGNVYQFTSKSAVPTTSESIFLGKWTRSASQKVLIEESGVAHYTLQGVPQSVSWMLVGEYLVFSYTAANGYDYYYILTKNGNGLEGFFLAPDVTQVEATFTANGFYTLKIDGEYVEFVTAGSKPTAVEEPTAPSGQKFDGWVLAGSETPFSFDAVMTADASIVAKFVEDTTPAPTEGEFTGDSFSYKQSWSSTQVVTSFTFSSDYSSVTLYFQNGTTLDCDIDDVTGAGWLGSYIPVGSSGAIAVYEMTDMQSNSYYFCFYNQSMNSVKVYSEDDDLLGTFTKSGAEQGGPGPVEPGEHDGTYLLQGGTDSVGGQAADKLVIKGNELEVYNGGTLQETITLKWTQNTATGEWNGFYELVITVGEHQLTISIDLLYTQKEFTFYEEGHEPEVGGGDEEWAEFLEDYQGEWTGSVVHPNGYAYDSITIEGTTITIKSSSAYDSQVWTITSIEIATATVHIEYAGSRTTYRGTIVFESGTRCTVDLSEGAGTFTNGEEEPGGEGSESVFTGSVTTNISGVGEVIITKITIDLTTTVTSIKAEGTKGGVPFTEGESVWTVDAISQGDLEGRQPGTFLCAYTFRILGATYGTAYLIVYVDGDTTTLYLSKDWGETTFGSLTLGEGGSEGPGEEGSYTMIIDFAGTYGFESSTAAGWTSKENHGSTVVESTYHLFKVVLSWTGSNFTLVCNYVNANTGTVPNSTRTYYLRSGSALVTDENALCEGTFNLTTGSYDAAPVTGTVTFSVVDGHLQLNFVFGSNTGSLAQMA